MCIGQYFALSKNPRLMLSYKHVGEFSPFQQDAGEGSLDALSNLVIGLRGSGGGSTGCRWHKKISGFVQQRRG